MNEYFVGDVLSQFTQKAPVHDRSEGTLNVEAYEVYRVVDYLKLAEELEDRRMGPASWPEAVA